MAMQANANKGPLTRSIRKYPYQGNPLFHTRQLLNGVPYHGPQGVIGIRSPTSRNTVTSRKNTYANRKTGSAGPLNKVYKNDRHTDKSNQLSPERQCDKRFISPYSRRSCPRTIPTERSVYVRNEECNNNMSMRERSNLKSCIRPGLKELKMPVKTRRAQYQGISEPTENFKAMETVFELCPGMRQVNMNYQPLFIGAGHCLSPMQGPYYFPSMDKSVLARPTGNIRQISMRNSECTRSQVLSAPETSRNQHLNNVVMRRESVDSSESSSSSLRSSVSTEMSSQSRESSSGSVRTSSESQEVTSSASEEKSSASGENSSTSNDTLGMLLDEISLYRRNTNESMIGLKQRGCNSEMHRHETHIPTMKSFEKSNFELTEPYVADSNQPLGNTYSRILNTTPTPMERFEINTIPDALDFANNTIKERRRNTDTTVFVGQSQTHPHGDKSTFPNFVCDTRNETPILSTNKPEQVYNVNLSSANVEHENNVNIPLKPSKCRIQRYIGSHVGDFQRPRRYDSGVSTATESTSSLDHGHHNLHGDAIGPTAPSDPGLSRDMQGCARVSCGQNEHHLTGQGVPSDEQQRTHTSDAHTNFQVPMATLQTRPAYFNGSCSDFQHPEGSMSRISLSSCPSPAIEHVNTKTLQKPLRNVISSRAPRISPPVDASHFQPSLAPETTNVVQKSDRRGKITAGHTNVNFSSKFINSPSIIDDPNHSLHHSVSHQHDRTMPNDACHKLKDENPDVKSIEFQFSTMTQKDCRPRSTANRIHSSERHRSQERQRSTVYRVPDVPSVSSHLPQRAASDPITHINAHRYQSETLYHEPGLLSSHYRLFDHDKSFLHPRDEYKHLYRNRSYSEGFGNCPMFEDENANMLKRQRPSDKTPQAYSSSEEEEWWLKVQGEGYLRRSRDVRRPGYDNDDVNSYHLIGLDNGERCHDMLSPVDHEADRKRAKLRYLISVLKRIESKENYIQTIENSISSSRTHLKSQYDVQEVAFDGHTSFSGSLSIGDVFLARDWGMRKKPLKHAVFTKAYHVLTTESLDQILAKTDPGFEVEAANLQPCDKEIQDGETTKGQDKGVAWHESLQKLHDWLKDRPEGNFGPINILLMGFRKSRCDLKYTLEVEPITDDRGVHLLTKCKFHVEDKLLASAVGLGKKQAKSKACGKALELLKSQDLETIVKILFTNDTKATDEEADKLLQERCKFHTPTNMASVLDSLIARLKQNTASSKPCKETVAMETLAASDGDVTGTDAVTLVTKLCIQMKVKLTTVFKRVFSSSPSTEETADDSSSYSNSKQSITCVVYLADRLLASCHSSSRREAHASAFKATYATLMAATGNELLRNFPVWDPEELYAPEVIDVVYKGHTKTTESNRYRFHRLHKQPEVSRQVSDLVLLEHQDWSSDRFKHAHCILSQSATQSGLLLEWTVEQGLGSFSCELRLQGQKVASCVAATKREAINLASVQALFYLFETHPVVQVFHPDHANVWVTRNMILQGVKVAKADETVINIEEPVEEAPSLDHAIASNIERHVAAFFHQPTLREFVSSPDWATAERNHLRHVALVRGLRCFTDKSYKGEIVVLSMRLDLLEHVAILRQEASQCQGRYRLLPDAERPSRGDVAGDLAANESVFVKVRKDTSSRHGSDETYCDEEELDTNTESSHYITANTTWESNTSIANEDKTLALSSPSSFTQQPRATNNDDAHKNNLGEDSSSESRSQIWSGREDQSHPTESNSYRDKENSANARAMIETKSTSSADPNQPKSHSQHDQLSSLPPKIVSSTPGKQGQEKTKKKESNKRSLFATVVSPVISLSHSPSKLLLLASCGRSASCRSKAGQQKGARAGPMVDQTDGNGETNPEETDIPETRLDLDSGHILHV